jgi:hypothetical protein
MGPLWLLLGLAIGQSCSQRPTAAERRWLREEQRRLDREAEKDARRQAVRDRWAAGHKVAVGFQNAAVLAVFLGGVGAFFLFGPPCCAQPVPRTITFRSPMRIDVENYRWAPAPPKDGPR